MYRQKIILWWITSVKLCSIYAFTLVENTPRLVHKKEPINAGPFICLTVLQKRRTKMLFLFTCCSRHRPQLQNYFNDYQTKKETYTEMYFINEENSHFDFKGHMEQWWSWLTKTRSIGLNRFSICFISLVLFIIHVPDLVHLFLGIWCLWLVMFYQTRCLKCEINTLSQR